MHAAVEPRAIAWWARMPLRAWVRLRASELQWVPRPFDEPRVRIDGPDPRSILVLGSGAATGWGVNIHALSLIGGIARAIRAHERRGAEVDGLIDPGMTTTSAVVSLPDTLGPFESIAVVLGVNDVLALTPPRRWQTAFAALLDALRARSDASILVVGIQPISSIPAFRGRAARRLDRYAEELNRSMRATCAARPGFSFVPLPAVRSSDPQSYRDALAYLEWGDRIAQAIAATEPDARGEQSRQAAVDALALDAGPEDRFDRIVRYAQLLTGTPAAAFTIIDGDLQWSKASAGFDLGEVPRRDAFCSITVQTGEPLVVPDARLDPRFQDSSIVVSGPGIRYYAGFPVDAPGGQHIGALCVFDTMPHAADDIDVELLRGLAQLVQDELALPSDPRR